MAIKWTNKSAINRVIEMAERHTDREGWSVYFPQFNFSSFYLYMEDLLGSNVNVARDRIQFVA